MEATHNEMTVLTTYLTDVQGSVGPNGESLRHTRPIMCNTIYEGGGSTHKRKRGLAAPRSFFFFELLEKHLYPGHLLNNLLDYVFLDDITYPSLHDRLPRGC